MGERRVYQQAYECTEMAAFFDVAVGELILGISCSGAEGVSRTSIRLTMYYAFVMVGKIEKIKGLDGMMSS